MRNKFALGGLSLMLSTGLPTIAGAQPLDEIGNRAAAMAAFVAVADDASAVYWNPAGLVSGPFFNIGLDFGQTTVKPDEQWRQAGRSSGSFLSAGVPPLGISYYRGHQTELSPAGTGSSGRQDRQVVVRSVQVTEVGVTVLQSLTDGVTVGATGRLVRGSFGSGVITIRDWDEGFDRAEVFDAAGRTTGDVDAGMLASRGQWRVGVVARNLAAPRFEADNGDAYELARHVRLGMAWGSGWPGLSRTVIALDADVTRVSHVGGERRDIAAGAERWFRNRSMAVRGGLRASTLGEARPVASAGASYAVRSGIYVEVTAATGREGDRRWGIAGRLIY